jgi:hypothetical protein
MPEPEHIAQQEELLETLRRGQAHNIQRRARRGADVPFSLAEDIRMAYDEIAGVKAVLRGWGMAIEDLPGDAPATSDTPTLDQNPSKARWEEIVAELSEAEIVVFKQSLETTCYHIDQLSVYKTLHDLLHKLEFECYQPIMNGAGDFPDNEYFRPILRHHKDDLRDIVGTLYDLADLPNFPQSERAWIDQLNQAADLLQGAIKNASKEQLKRAIILIERVRLLNPTRINECLKNAARSLRLDTLIETMAVVSKRYANSDYASDRLRVISQGLTELKQIHGKLGSLIIEHDIWQMYEPDLRQIEGQLAQHMQQLEWLWQELKPALVMLCGSRDDRWTRNLRQTIEDLDQAIVARTLDAIAEIFYDFHRQFSLCFFRADKELKEECIKLRHIDGPLRSVLGMLG